MDNSIQFFANYEDWKVIKKLKIESATDPRTIMEFLASLTGSVDTKIEVNLRKIVDLKQVDDFLDSLELGKGDVSKALEIINGRKLSSIINSICDLPALQKNEKKEVADFCKAYASRVALKKCKIEVDYSNVEIPGMKRLKKVKK